MKSSYKLDLLSTYKELAPLIQDINKVSIKDLEENNFKPTVIAAFVKCFEFNISINEFEENRHSFYFTSFLRGICEDLISLTFLSKFPENDQKEIVKEYNLYLITSSIQSQQIFFQKERPFQPIVDSNLVITNPEQHSNSLNSIWEKHGYRKDRLFPSVEHMAIDSKLKILYDFLYHATSRTVHFSPNVLLRTGWYKNSKSPIVFSTNNFSEYYSLFNSFYGTYLFIQFVNSFKKILNLDKSFMTLIKKLKATIEEFYFYPEIITFEELNLKRPTNIQYKVLDLAYKMDKEERKTFLNALPEILKEVKKKTKNEKK